MTAKASYFTASARKSAKNRYSALMHVKLLVESALLALSPVILNVLIARVLSSVAKSVRNAWSLVVTIVSTPNVPESVSKSVIVSHAIKNVH